MTEFRDQHDLPYERLVAVCDPASLPFKTTAELAPLTNVLGQERALRSIDFALGMNRSGYNLFAAGADGLGKSTIAEGLLRGRAASMGAPSDWVYVSNFDDPDRPLAISFPAGQARRFASAVTVATRLAISNLREAFASDAYVRQRQDHAQQLQGRREAILTAIQTRASALGFAVEFLPHGLMSTPIVDGQPVDDQAITTLPIERRTAIEEAGHELEEFVQESMLHIRALERESAARVAAIDANVSEQAIANELDPLIAQWGGEGKVAGFLGGTRADLIARRAFWLEPHQAGPWSTGPAEPELAAFRRYEVNVLIANDGATGAPVISENNPTFGNLLGRIEYFSQFGGMSTDHTMIRPGALLLANGGYLVLRVRDLLANPGAYEGLKRALARRAVAIENLSQVLSIMPTAGLRPEPIPIDLKVVLIGDSAMYSAMFRLDPDFRDLFRVKADFDTEFERTSMNVMGLASFVHSESTLAFNAQAVARLVEHSSRLVADQRKLSANMGAFGDIVHQAEFWATREGASEVDAQHVERALEESDYRSALVREHMQELIQEGSLLIATSGEAVGSVNALSVIDLGDTSFGFPSKVTCVTGAGNGTITNLERESDLAGRIHNKGFLALRAFLLEHFGQRRAMAIQSSVTFEQLYGEVDGDSASSTELYALLSSLSGVPISQAIAVTGSVNQRGEVQPIGGVTTKIEGFYRVCCERGLDALQGVMIPSANVQSVVLCPEVAGAVREGRFHVWAVSTIEDGLELLTGMPAGTRGTDGLYPQGSVFRIIEDRLDELALAVDGRPAPAESSRMIPAPSHAPQLPGVPPAPPPAPPVQVRVGRPDASPGTVYPDAAILDRG